MQSAEIDEYPAMRIYINEHHGQRLEPYEDLRHVNFQVFKPRNVANASTMPETKQQMLDHANAHMYTRDPKARCDSQK